ncbi:TonB C-terminal domain-containing protein [Bradyrhizobium embrapense]|uniref:TonB C-terminal domain-containing protein n=1 Tax=Bradyrhizobium embrapense TaxID=630921 RepID=UPI00067C3997|nr:TonB C-terminal domain-containing protein [Bradyrhizobium embrapense]
MWQRFLALIIGTVVAGNIQTATMAESLESSRASAPVDFDIGAQPLAAALDAYSAASGLQVVYDATLAAGRRGQAVRGSVKPDMALQLLLEGTGLVAIYVGTNAFTIAPMVAERQTTPIHLFKPYLASVQSRVEEVFCRSALTAPGSYRIKFRFWIGPAGEVLQPQLLGSTDDDARDQAIAAMLRAVVIGRPPPPDMPQPVTMAVSARPPSETGDCVASDPRRRGLVAR